MEFPKENMKKSKKTSSVKMQPKKFSVAASTRHELEEQEYDADFYKWTKNQAKFLKKREFSKLDLDHLIEEIESLGRSEKRTLKSYVELLLMYKLKIKFQPRKHTISWDLSVKEANHKAQTTLQENPSLKPKLKDIVNDAYFSARLKAALETGMEEETFPIECPWNLKDLFPDLEKKYLS
jgi:Domain of unknown function DUF29